MIGEQLNWIKKILKIEKALNKLETGEDVVPMSKAFSELVDQLRSELKQMTQISDRDKFEREVLPIKRKQSREEANAVS